MLGDYEQFCNKKTNVHEVVAVLKLYCYSIIMIINTVELLEEGVVEQKDCSTAKGNANGDGKRNNVDA